MATSSSEENVSIASGVIEPDVHVRDGMSLKQMLTRFFGLDDDEKTIESWERRKHIHISRYGKIRTSHPDTTDRGDDTTDGGPSTEPLQRDSSRPLPCEEHFTQKRAPERSPKSQCALSLLYQLVQSKMNVIVQRAIGFICQRDVSDHQYNNDDDNGATRESLINPPSAAYNATKGRVNLQGSSSSRRSPTSPVANTTTTNKSSCSGRSRCIRTCSEIYHEFRRRYHVNQSEEQHRPYFTYWVTTLQAVILISSLIIYWPLAPFGFSEEQVEEDILISQNGILHVARVGQTVVHNIWIGPSLESLILLGAKYGPCMRRDKIIFEKLDEERSAENRTGCCMQTMNSGCIQRLQSECTSSFTQFKENSVCGQDPKACVKPASVPPKEWSKNIIEWPICRETLEKSNLDKEEFPHMHCKVTGHPCCIATQAQCIITSQDYCRFRKGTFHPNKTLCSQVNCLSSTCGLFPFKNSEVPDQIYRLFFSLFLHTGVLHFMVSLLVNLTILRWSEKTFGWLRILLLYLLSGIGGNLWSSIFFPYEPEAGPTGSMFGVFSLDFILLACQWSLFESSYESYVALAKLVGIFLFGILVGMLPYIDNIAHIFGFLYGLLLSPLFIRDISSGNKKRRLILIVVFGIIFLVVTILGFILFYTLQTSYKVKYLNCLPITERFCQNYHQGYYLEPRTIDY